VGDPCVLGALTRATTILHWLRHIDQGQRLRITVSCARPIWTDSSVDTESRDMCDVQTNFGKKGDTPTGRHDGNICLRYAVVVPGVDSRRFGLLPALSALPADLIIIAEVDRGRGHVIDPLVRSLPVYSYTNCSITPRASAGAPVALRVLRGQVVTPKATVRFRMPFAVRSCWIFKSLRKRLSGRETNWVPLPWSKRRPCSGVMTPLRTAGSSLPWRRRWS
jgi:hypothetical protein